MLIFRYRFLMLCSFVVLMLLATASHAGDRSLGLPVAIAPSGNPATAAKVALGEAIFFDKRFSLDGTVSCASCHQPEKAFTDGIALAVGVEGKVLTRNAPSLLNVAFNAPLFWDGQHLSLEAVVLGGFVNPREFGLKDFEEVLVRVRKDAGYVKAFRQVLQVQAQDIQAQHVEQALVAFLRTLLAGDSPFDRYMFKGDKKALSPSAERGLMLFKGPAKCDSCHKIEEKDALFTDNKFHSLGIGLKSAGEKMASVTAKLVKAKESNQSLEDAVLSDEDIAELGHFVVTLNPADIGKFRTPSLRNVALTAPYMHDGSVETLEDAVEWETYYRHDDGARPLVLTPGEKEDLIEFLKSLSSPVATNYVDPTKKKGKQR